MKNNSQHTNIQIKQRKNKLVPSLEQQYSPKSAHINYIFCPQIVRSQMHHRFGSIHIKYLLFFFIPLLIGACLYTYHQAVTKHEQKPFPHSTITNTACHYSQNILFRLIMLTSQSFLNFIYFVLFNWLKMIIKKTCYPEKNLKFLQNLSQFSLLGFFAALATIDGAGYPLIHIIGAVFYFLTLLGMTINLTLLLRDLYKWDPSFFNPQSILIKTIMIGWLCIIMIYGLVGVLTENESNDDDVYIVIVQWNLFFGGLLWLLSFVNQWKSVFLSLKGDFKSTVKRL